MIVGDRVFTRGNNFPVYGSQNFCKIKAGF